MLAEGLAAAYWEPESLVMSRSGDECVVAEVDQWYLKYGEEEWRGAVDAWVRSDQFSTYNPLTKQAFLTTIGWLKEWACSRSFGLGTLLPWDPQFVIESLSDSTIYMAYYTVAHFLQNGSLTGHLGNPDNIKPEHMTDDVWDYIFLGTAPKSTCPIPKAVLDKMRNEFLYFYPMDLRVSGKDLVPNHLTYSLYNHAAIFDKEHWPRAFRANGHLLINAEKMSKSTGNFLTMADSINMYTADGTRLALADSGDGLEDANFEQSVANAAVLKLYADLEWMTDMLKQLPQLRTGPMNTFADQVFLSNINRTIIEADEAYEKMMFKVALKSVFHEFRNMRGQYLEMVSPLPPYHNAHRDLIVHYITVQAILLSPICPHICEHIWAMLGHKTSILSATWPEAGRVDQMVTRKAAYLESTRHELDVKYRSFVQRNAKKKLGPPTSCTLYVAPAYPVWQQDVLAALEARMPTLKALFAAPPAAAAAAAAEQKDESGKKDKSPLQKFKAEFQAVLKEMESIKSTPSAMKRLMPFVDECLKRFEAVGPVALERILPFNELDILNECSAFVKPSGVTEFLIKPNTENEKASEEATPGNPFVMFN